MISHLCNALIVRMGAAFAQPATPPEEAAGATALTTLKGVTEHQADFQPYIFLAYGLACLLLLIFSLWTFLQTKQLERKTEYLKERLLRAHPDALDRNEG